MIEKIKRAICKSKTTGVVKRSLSILSQEPRGREGRCDRKENKKLKSEYIVSLQKIETNFSFALTKKTQLSRETNI
jgi:hypothetical protein